MPIHMRIQLRQRPLHAVADFVPPQESPRVCAPRYIPQVITMTFGLYRRATSSSPSLLRAADRYAYNGCGSTAYCYLFYLRDEQILIHIENSCRSSACLVRIAGPCPAVPFQLVPAQLGLSPAGPYQLWCTSLRITTETRPAHNTLHHDNLSF